MEVFFKPCREDTNYHELPERDPAHPSYSAMPNERIVLPDVPGRGLSTVWRPRESRDGDVFFVGNSQGEAQTLLCKGRLLDVSCFPNGLADLCPLGEGVMGLSRSNGQVYMIQGSSLNEVSMYGHECTKLTAENGLIIGLFGAPGSSALSTIRYADQRLYAYVDKGWRAFLPTRADTCLDLFDIGGQVLALCQKSDRANFYRLDGTCWNECMPERSAFPLLDRGHGWRDKQSHDHVTVKKCAAGLFAQFRLRKELFLHRFNGNPEQPGWTRCHPPELGKCIALSECGGEIFGVFAQKPSGRGSLCHLSGETWNVVAPASHKTRVRCFLVDQTASPLALVENVEGARSPVLYQRDARGEWQCLAADCRGYSITDLAGGAAGNFVLSNGIPFELVATSDGAFFRATKAKPATKNGCAQIWSRNGEVFGHFSNQSHYIEDDPTIRTYRVVDGEWRPLANQGKYRAREAYMDVGPSYITWLERCGDRQLLLAQHRWSDEPVRCFPVGPRESVLMYEFSPDYLVLTLFTQRPVDGNTSEVVRYDIDLE